MIKYILSFIVATFATIVNAQTLYVPGSVGSSSNANVGVGVSDPWEKLHVDGTVGIGKFSDAGHAGLKVQYSEAGGVSATVFKHQRWVGDFIFRRNSASGERNQMLLGGSSAHYLDVFDGNNQTNVRLHAGGNSFFTGGKLGIGTTSPVNNFEVTNNSGTPTIGIRGDLNSKLIFEPNDGSDRFVIHAEMNVNTYYDKLKFIAANANNILVLKGDGLVGIGTDAPTQKLHVKGGKVLMSNDVFDGINMSFDATQVPVIRFTRFLGSGSNHHNAFAGQIWNPDMAEYSYAIGTASVNNGNLETASTRMVVSVNGNVGIGTTLPDERLTVKGKIHTSEVRVDLAPNVGPDYVFDKEYELMSLSEVETYIKVNKHLPEVPSAKQMEAEGMHLKEMNLLLLKKVEELTLHLIEMKKQNELQAAQLSKVDTMQAELAEMRMRVAGLQEKLK